MTLNEFINDIFMRNFLPRHKSTQQTYTVYINQYISPNLGAKDLEAIKVLDVQNLMDWMAEGSQHGLQCDICRDTITRTIALLRRIYNIAVEMELVKSNPVKTKLLKNRGSDSGHHKALSDMEIHRVRDRIPRLKIPMQRTCMALITYTGMRPEELRGLRWEDIHIEEKYLVIRRAVTYTCGKIHIDTPKTESANRTIYIVEPLQKILRDAPIKRGFVCHGRDREEAIAESSWVKFCNNILEQLGMKGKYTMYDFRTTFATNCKEAGLTSIQIAEMMGHADTRMVEKIYAPRRHESVMKNGEFLERFLS
mgnify:CR=1 FL=1